MNSYIPNILASYDAATHEQREQGSAWYATAHADCTKLAQDLGISPDAVMGAAAAISPGMRWSLVIAHVGMLHQAMRHKRKHSVPTYCALFVARARKMLRGEPVLDVLRGPKVTAFYLAIRDAGTGQHVVIDGHAWNIANGLHGVIRSNEYNTVTMPALTAKRYRDVAQAYAEAAVVRGVSPCAMQAITWMQHRASKGLSAS